MLAIQEARIGATKKAGASLNAPAINESPVEQIIAQEPENETLRALTERQKARAGRFWPLARKIAGEVAGRFRFADVDWDGAAAIGLVDAARRFRRRGGASFPTFLRARVRGACYDAVRQARIKGYRRAREQDGPVVWPLEEAIWVFTSGRLLRRNRPNFDVVTADEDPVGWEIESEEAVIGLTRGLRGRQREILRRLYLHADQSNVKLGRDLGVCQSRVSQLVTAGLEELRHEIEAGKGRAA